MCTHSLSLSLSLSLSFTPLCRSASPSLQLRGNFFLYCADCGPVLPGIRGYSRISARAFSLFNTSPHSSSFQQMARDRGETRNRSCAETCHPLPSHLHPQRPAHPLFSTPTSRFPTPPIALRKGGEFGYIPVLYTVTIGNAIHSRSVRLEAYRMLSPSPPIEANLLSHLSSRVSGARRGEG